MNCTLRDIQFTQIIKDVKRNQDVQISYKLEIVSQEHSPARPNIWTVVVFNESLLLPL